MGDAFYVMLIHHRSGLCPESNQNVAFAKSALCLTWSEISDHIRWLICLRDESAYCSKYFRSPRCDDSQKCCSVLKRLRFDLSERPRELRTHLGSPFVVSWRIVALRRCTICSVSSFLLFLIPRLTIWRRGDKRIEFQRQDYLHSSVVYL